jgi:hypothetical protein
MDELYGPRPVARWYWIAAVASVLFMAVGCWGYVMDVTTDPTTLPLDQRNLVLARPVWQVAAYAIAVWVGLIGALLLLVRRKLAVPLLLVSLIGAVVTFLPYATVPAIRDNITTNDIGFASAIILITGTIWSFARHSRQRGWLR